MSVLPSHLVDIFLENGHLFQGQAFGDFSKPRFGEFVFCTAMSGVEEALSDPSYCGQVLVSTVAHVGNTGFNGEDMESAKIWTEGLVCRHLESHPTNWRHSKTLAEWIVNEGRFVVEGINTRLLTTILREEGSQRGVIVPRDQFESSSAAVDYIKSNVPSMQGTNLIDDVSTKEPYLFKEKKEEYWPTGDDLSLFPGDQLPTQTLDVAVWDFGIKTNTLRMLNRLGCRCHVIPATAKADEILEAGKHGIMLSNGPGDPAAAGHVIEELKKVLGKRPLFAICMGHQLVAHACGAKTYKMKFGHRGIHHPVVEVDGEGRMMRTWITSQNHGFAVEQESLPSGVGVSFQHADDKSVEGLTLPERLAETVQFHPEAGPGPTESGQLFLRFIQRMNSS